MRHVNAVFASLLLPALLSAQEATDLAPYKLPSAPNAQGTSCGSAFQSSGSMLRGTTYQTAADVGAITVGDALTNIASHLATVEVTVVRNDTAGVLYAEGSTGSRKYPINFTATTTGTTRIAVDVKLPAGVFANKGQVRDELCRMISFATLPPLPAATKAVTPAQAENTQTSIGKSPAPPALTNEEVIKMAAAGLEDEIIVAKVRAAAHERLDVSTDALIELRKTEGE
ncbi:MAG TPA: hypothetical protein VGQ76_07815 [Thermoanaerobaculia bacterium]|jgi:hypothetical protein|nr:hypothetical protein [Thermoanaerobaculia bacterium]